MLLHLANCILVFLIHCCRSLYFSTTLPTHNHPQPPATIHPPTQIVTSDILIGTGVLHVIDWVMLPDLDVGVTQTITRAVNGTDDLTVLTKMIEAAGMAAALDAPLFRGTLLAPTDQVGCDRGLRCSERRLL